MRLTKEQHLTKARLNEQFLERINTDDTVGVEWAITVNFYTALHYVQAYFSTKFEFPMTHTHRTTAIERDAQIKNAYEDYRELEDISRVARYDYSMLTKGHLKFSKDCLDAVRSVVQPLLER